MFSFARQARLGAVGLVAMGRAVVILCFVLVWPAVVLQPVAGDDVIVFPDKAADLKKTSAVSTSSPQPKTIGSHDDGKTKEGEVKPRFGFDAGGVSSSFNIGVQPSGISGSASFSGSYGGQGQGHSGSQSQSFNFQAGANGFSASQSASQASSFNSQFPGYYGSGGPSLSGSQASSQASSISAGAGGVSGSSAASQASSFGFQGAGANIGGSSSSANSQGFSTAGGRPGGGFGYYPNGGGATGSSSQSAGGSFGGSGGFESYPNVKLPPEFIRGYHQGNRKNNGRRKYPGWFTEAFPVSKREGEIVFPS